LALGQSRDRSEDEHGGCCNSNGDNRQLMVAKARCEYIRDDIPEKFRTEEARQWAYTALDIGEDMSTFG
jgi:hypothetical protein